MARRHLKLTAVVAVVLVSLTGFRPHGHGSSGHGGSGGGCSAHSSSSGYHSSHSHYDDDDDDYDSSSGSGGTDSSASPTASPQGTVVECVSAHPKAARPAAKVRLAGGDDLYDDVTITVEFRAADGAVVDTGERTVDPVLDSEDDTYGDPVFRVPMAHPDRAGKVTRCEVRSVR